MEEGGCSKVTIRQIVRLKGVLHKWQRITKSSKTSNPGSDASDGSTSPIKSKRVTSLMCFNNSDEEDGCPSPGPAPPRDVPKGYLAVYVGPEQRRFIVPTSYLTHSLFKVLLEKVEEEFGFDHSGVLTIPCEIETFKYLLKCMESQKEHLDNSSSCDLLALGETEGGNSRTLEE